MKILFEGCQYKTDVLEEIISSRFFSPLNNPSFSVVDYVGYYYNSNINDAVIILPKVFIYEDGQAFGKYSPVDILTPDENIKKRLREDGTDKLLFNISTWIYRAIILFRKRQKETSIIEEEEINNVISNFGESDSTELDIILSLIKFHKENQHLFTYVAKLNHTGQKIYWNKTVSKCTPHISDNVPIYTNTIAKKKSINFDEELIIIFYSVLQHIKYTYGFNVIFNQNYDLIKGQDYERLLRKGTRKLKSIKNKYFTDRFIALWKLLYPYFERSEANKKSEKKREEVLLIQNFNIVFEDMIDDLIGDGKENIPHYFSDQLDGKRVDHLYRYQSLIMNDDIYFVGDSKYYKPSNKVGQHSVEKQYTYAKNIIQYNINLFNKDNLPNGIRYRDPLTEGYNITPNFFISALIDKDYDFLKDGLDRDEDAKKPDIQYHFENRLFDRDTLLVQRYNINFLFVLSSYTSRSSHNKVVFKNKARKQFRARMIEYFSDHYDFFEVTPREITIVQFVEKYFRLLNGRIYQPSQMNGSVVLAKSKSDKVTIEAETFFDECIVTQRKLI